MTKYIQEKDPNYNYRRFEILPDVWQVLERARERRGAVFISQNHIDKLIRLQEENEQKAIAWLKYLFIGELNYLDVYGENAAWKQCAKKTESENMICEIAALKNEISELKQMVLMLIEQNKTA